LDGRRSGSFAGILVAGCRTCVTCYYQHIFAGRGHTVSNILNMAYNLSSSTPLTTVPRGFSPLTSLSAALVFSTSLLITAGCSFFMASFCSAGLVFGLVGRAVGADCDEGISGSIDAVGACLIAVGSEGWETVDGWVPS